MKTNDFQPETGPTTPGASGQQGKTPVSHAGSAGSVTREAHQLTAIETAKFWSQVKGGLDHVCWEWQGRKNGAGYGRCHRTQAHRVAYTLTKGTIPDGLLVRHRCDNPSCCNPKHLLVGTISDNMQDALERGQFATGLRHGNVKLTPEAVAYIRKNPERMTVRKLAEKFSVATGTISQVQNWRTWRWRL